jgi:hypothetical protein
MFSVSMTDIEKSLNLTEEDWPEDYTFDHYHEF